MDLKPYGGRTREQREGRCRLPDASTEEKEEKPGLGALEGLEFNTVLGLQTEEDTRWEWAVASASSLPLLTHCKGCMEDCKYIPSREEPNFYLERNVVKFSGEGEGISDIDITD